MPMYILNTLPLNEIDFEEIVIEMGTNNVDKICPHITGSIKKGFVPRCIERKENMLV